MHNVHVDAACFWNGNLYQRGDIISVPRGAQGPWSPEVSAPDEAPVGQDRPGKKHQAAKAEKPSVESFL